MNWFRNLKIARKFALCFGTLLLLMIVTDGLSLLSLRGARARTVQLTDNRLPSVARIGSLKELQARVRILTLQHVISEDPEMMSTLGTFAAGGGGQHQQGAVGIQGVSFVTCRADAL